jgi:hypothetical protein
MIVTEVKGGVKTLPIGLSQRVSAKIFSGVLGFTNHAKTVSTPQDYEF